MQITYETSVANAMIWQLIIANTGELFTPLHGKISFVREINDDVLKIRYEFFTAAPITINYTCSTPDGTTFNDPKKASPYISTNNKHDSISIRLKKRERNLL